VNALSRMIDGVRRGGFILDLQVIHPDPWIELDGKAIDRVDAAPLLAWADAAVAAVDARIAAGDLREDAVDDHDVRTHYASGAELVDDIAGSKRRLSEQTVGLLHSIERPLVIRERCRTRRLRVC
jgi:hypothetical protein